jgi:hypothetical protein
MAKAFADIIITPYGISFGEKPACCEQSAVSISCCEKEKEDALAILDGDVSFPRKPLRLAWKIQFISSFLVSLRPIC